MARVMDKAADHPQVAFLVVFAVLFSLASVIARIDAVHNGRRFEAGPAHVTSSEAEARAMADEPARLAALRKEHTDTTDEALAYLVANAWEGASGTVVEFTETCIRTRGDGKESWEPFAVCSSASRRSREGDVPVTVWALGIETGAWREVLTLTVRDQASAAEPPERPTVACDGIASGEALAASRDLRPLELVGPDEATLEAHGTDPEAVCQALARWCADWRPTARVATWDQTVLEDYGRRSWDVRYGLDDRRQTEVTVAIDMDTHELEIREGR